MTEPPPHHATAALLQDWITIWHSELSALLADRELQEAGQRMIDAWAALAVHATGVALDAARHAGPGAPPGPAAAGAAPDGRDAAIAALRARVDDLERRLAQLAPP